MKTLLWCACCVFLAAEALAQTTQPRDRVAAPANGTAIIKGRVIDAQTGSGLARARVRLQGFAPDRPAATTDDRGAFEITNVPAGPVFLIVDRAGYMGTRYPEVGQTIRGNLRPLTVTDGQILDGVNVPLFRGSVIVGRVLDQYGEPAESVTIQILRVPASGHGRPQQRGSAQTNDLGEFRIPRLEPGSYLLRAMSRNNADEPGETQSLPTYYPGVVSIDDAQPIAIGRAQTASGIELMLLDGTPSVISGTVVDANGQPAPSGTYVNARQISDFTDMVAGGTGVRPDGTFRMKVAPGDYTLEVHAVRPGVFGRPGAEDQQFGRLRISVGGAPLSDLTIVLGPGATMSGTVSFEGDGPLPSNAEQIMVGVGPLPFGSTCQSDRGSGLTDGNFRVQGVVGTCIVRVMGNLGRWNVKSISQGESDLMDRPVTFDPGRQLRNVHIVLTDKRTELALHVTDDHGLATHEYVGIVFSTDKTKWTDLSRYVRVYVPQPPGIARLEAPMPASADLRPAPGERRDLIAGMPPGEYYAVAVTDLAPDDAR